MHWGISIFVMILFILLSVMIYTLLERKILSYSQSRVGPNKIVISGLLQPLLDGFKLMLNSMPEGFKRNKYGFVAGPLLLMVTMLFLWSSLPMIYFYTTIKFLLMYIMVFIGMSIYSILLSSWSSNSKFSTLGFIRAMAQTISYELSLIFSILPMMIIMSSMTVVNLYFLQMKYFFMFAPLCLIWFINILAESARAPFDFVEGESELVSGFNTEFPSSPFALLFVGEYGVIIFMSLITIFIFFTSWVLAFPLIFFVLIYFLIIRSTFPRFRYDFLMDLAWLKLLPVSILYLFIFMNMYLPI